jgi:hypothetical protein
MRVLRPPGRMRAASPLVALLLILHSPLPAQRPPGGGIEGTVDFQSSDLPIILIDTHGQFIGDGRITADMTVIDNGPGVRNSVTDAPDSCSGRIGIELRGVNSAQKPQKPYRVETQDSPGNNRNVKLLGLPRENDWVFYSPYVDETLIRNALAFRLANDIGRYASRTRFFELVLNGDYQGLYVLLEKIKRDKNRVNVSEMDADDTAGDSLTGGYIFKIDKWAGENIGGWRSALGIQYQYDYPKNDDIVAPQKAYIKAFVDGFERAMADDWTASPLPGYLRIIDLESFVDHFIISEFTKNVDSYRISTFMHKDRDSKDGRLVMGPVWDMDLSMANAYFQEDFDLVAGWEVDYRLRRPSDGMQPPWWWEKLAHTAYFEAAADSRWRELRSGVFRKDSVYAVIDRMTAEITEARVRHFEKWPRALVGDTYENRVDRLKQWISNRLDWIDANITRLDTGVAQDPKPTQPADFGLTQNYPNPFNASTVIGYRLSAAGRVCLAIVDLRGREMRTLVDAVRPAGEYRVNWDGTDDRTVSAASGMYLVRMTVNGAIKTGKMLLLR